MKQIIETVGPYLGFVAVIGLIALTMLCFSMARDLRRLREWAGGAPERDAEVREVSEIVAEERSEELRVLAEREQRRRERSGLEGGSFWDRLGRTGRILMIVAVVVILGAAAAFAGTQLLGSDDGGSGGGGGGGKATKSGGGAVKPGNIQVAVLNGTGGVETGIAAQYANVLEQDGYQLGTVTDAPATFTESVVMYEPGNEAAAKKVAKAVGVQQTGPVTSDVSTAANAMVVVVIGTAHGELPAG